MIVSFGQLYCQNSDRQLVVQLSGFHCLNFKSKFPNRHSKFLFTNTIYFKSNVVNTPNVSDHEGGLRFGIEKHYPVGKWLDCYLGYDLGLGYQYRNTKESKAFDFGMLGSIGAVMGGSIFLGKRF